MIIRPETPADHDAIRALHLAAFAPSAGEAALVDALRAAGDHVPELCLAAFDDAGELVGHVFYSRARAGDAGVLALAPMAVTPAAQRRGVGSALVQASLELARRAAAFPLVVVLGHPTFYPRFGFSPAGEAGIECPFRVPDEAWMALALRDDATSVRGVVEYAPAFAAVV